MMREMSGEIGEEMGPEFDEVVSRLEKGESPEDIERAMPDLGAEGSDAEMDLD
jgi:predicted double-glycine peptidase